MIQCHNEIRDAIGDLASLVYMEVIREPVVQEGIRGVWQPQMVALFDIRVVDTDTPSYSHRDVAAIISSAEEDNKRKYCGAAEVRHASFTPLVVSVDGVLGWEAECFIKLLAEKIAIKWKKSYPEVAG